MKLLAINSSVKEAQICLINEDNRIIKEMDESKSHSEFLLKEIDNLLIANEVDISEIDCLSVNIGPGSFTGIRIGISFVKAFFYTKGNVIFKFIQVIKFYFASCISYSYLVSSEDFFI